MTFVPRETISNAAAGDSAALREICRIYGPPVYSFITVVAGKNPAVLREKMAGAFISALRSFQPDSGFGFRAELMRSIIKITAAMPSETAPAGSADNPRFVLLAEAMEKMPQHKKIYLMLRYQMDFLHEEIAWILDESPRETAHNLKESALLLRKNLSEAVRKKYARLSPDSSSNL